MVQVQRRGGFCVNGARACVARRPVRRQPGGKQQQQPSQESPAEPSPASPVSPCSLRRLWSCTCLRGGRAPRCVSSTTGWQTWRAARRAAAAAAAARRRVGAGQAGGLGQRRAPFFVGHAGFFLTTIHQSKFTNVQANRHPQAAMCPWIGLSAQRSLRPSSPPATPAAEEVAAVTARGNAAAAALAAGGEQVAAALFGGRVARKGWGGERGEDVLMPGGGMRRGGWLAGWPQPPTGLHMSGPAGPGRPGRGGGL